MEEWCRTSLIRGTPDTATEKNDNSDSSSSSKVNVWIRSALSCWDKIVHPNWKTALNANSQFRAGLEHATGRLSALLHPDDDICPAAEDVWLPFASGSPADVRALIVTDGPPFDIDPETGAPLASGLGFGVRSDLLPPEDSRAYRVLDNVMHCATLCGASKRVDYPRLQIAAGVPVTAAPPWKPLPGEEAPRAAHDVEPLDRIDMDATLMRWRAQGAFVLNSSLTSSPGQAGSHTVWGAVQLAAARAILEANPEVVVSVWGDVASQFMTAVQRSSARRLVHALPASRARRAPHKVAVATTPIHKGSGILKAKAKADLRAALSSMTFADGQPFHQINAELAGTRTRGANAGPIDWTPVLKRTSKRQMNA